MSFSLSFRHTVAIVFCGSLALLSACSSAPVYESRHRGLFDDLAERERMYHGSPSGREFARQDSIESESVERGPAARVVNSKSDSKTEQIKADAQSWSWPLQHVSVTSSFGERGHSFHEGVDLAAHVGTPAYAVDSGQVLFSGSNVRGYGRVIVLKHPKSGTMTVYAHLSRAFVHPGQMVKRGQKIALTGQTGHVSGPHLHFEVRKGVNALDPMRILPFKHVTHVAHR